MVVPVSQCPPSSTTSGYDDRTVLFAIMGMLLTILTVGDQDSEVVLMLTVLDVFRDALVGSFAYPALRS